MRTVGVERWTWRALESHERRSVVGPTSATWHSKWSRYVAPSPRPPALDCNLKFKSLLKLSTAAYYAPLPLSVYSSGRGYPSPLLCPRVNSTALR